LTSVAFPAWVWAQPRQWDSPTSGPGVQFLHASYAQQLALRDSVKCRRLIDSPWYQARWGERFRLTGDQNTKTRFDNDQNGSRLSTSVGSALTGEGGSIIVVDDPNAAQEAFSEATILSTIEWWDSALSTRLNDPKTGAFIVIQQRLSEEDLTGHILSKDIGEWTHLCLPMRYEWRRHSYTSIGWHDPRGLDDKGESLIGVDDDGNRVPVSYEAQGILEKREGALLWPERFGDREVTLLEKQLGPWAAAGQLQQRPEPKGGGIIKSDWWQPWDTSVFPPMDTIIACLDTAYTTKTENDPSAITVWGVFTSDIMAQASKHVNREGRLVEGSHYDARMYSENHPKVMLMYAWQGRHELHELVEKVSGICRKMRVDTLLIENKAAGHSVAQEIKRLYGYENFGVQLFDPKSQDKMARLYSVQHLFAEGMIYAPNKQWAEMVITQTAQFPKGKHDDLVDTVSMALRHLRNLGLLVRSSEWTADVENSMRFQGNKNVPLYPV
jgi:predicted phage terminase large subunit-like protein